MKRTLIIVAVVAVVFAWILLRPPTVNNHSGTGALRAAPEFTLTDLDGKKISLSAFRGRVVLLDFWATWCAPCKEEIPHFIDMQTRYGDRGLQVIGVSMDDDQKPVRDFQQQFRMNYPVVMGNSEMASQYGGTFGLPITFVIDSNGSIVARHIGQTKAEVFESEIQKLLPR